jgi:hypothetical protein
MSIKKDVNITLSDKAIQIVLTGVHELAFRVQKVKCSKDLLKTHSENAHRKPTDGITIQKIPEAFPHRYQDNARVVTTGTGDCEDIQCSPHKIMGRVRGTLI